MTSTAEPTSKYDRNDRPTDALVGAGIAFALLLPIVGVMIAITLQGKPGHAGRNVLLLSLAGFGIWAFLLSR